MSHEGSKLYLDLPLPVESILGITRFQVFWGKTVALLSQTQCWSSGSTTGSGVFSVVLGGERLLPLLPGAALLAPARCFANNSKGEEGRGRREGKERPKTVTSAPADTIQTANSQLSLKTLAPMGATHQHFGAGGCLS